MRSSRRQPVLNWEDPASPRRLSFVEANIFHAVTKAPVDVGQRLKRLRAELGRRPSKREREELRVFAPERAARMHWVGIVVRDPDRVYEATDREGRAGYLMEGDADPNGYPYVVFLQQSEEDPDDLFFVTAYPYMDEGNAVEDLRLGKLLYKRPGEKVTSPRLRKALGDGASAQLQVIQRPVPPARLRHYTGHVASPGWGITIIPPAGEKSNLLVAFGGK